MTEPMETRTLISAQRHQLPALGVGQLSQGATGVPLSAALAIYLDTLNSPHTRRAYGRACRQLLDVVGHQYPGSE